MSIRTTGDRGMPCFPPVGRSAAVAPRPRARLTGPEIARSLRPRFRAALPGTASVELWRSLTSFGTTTWWETSPPRVSPITATRSPMARIISSMRRISTPLVCQRLRRSNSISTSSWGASSARASYGVTSAASPAATNGTSMTT